jgi:pimeloyl-ACP methyl ester carboxylesterase
MDLEALRLHFGYDRWTFAGNSTGGMLGLIYAIDHADSLKKLVVAGASASNKYMDSKESIYCRENTNNQRIREIFSILKSSDSSKELKAQASREWIEMSLHHTEKWDGSEEIHRMIPGSKLHIFEDSDHSPHIEEPEVFRCIVQTFLHTVWG